ncbi:MAG: pyridoxal phosphate-dependent aminotransferase [Victivallaceae bacterium]|nr:pyridoxal phosphate-dependent aminotransferase [Victivallaceae bacterium]
MSLISQQIKSYMDNSSWIRKMFENGIELKAQHGAENVFDFSLGNPDIPPPAKVGETLKSIANELHKPFALGYMPNAGYPETRKALAGYLSREQGMEIGVEHVLVTCGAAGAINAFFRAVLESGDEVICPAPYFVEYGFYAGNFGGKLCPVKSKPLTFELDLAAIEAAFTERTRVVLINSPNNPTGKIYSRKELEALAALVKRYSERYGKPIFLVSDEPYRFLNYDNSELPSVFSLYEYSIVVGSFSKSLALAGARVGYFTVNPAMTGGDELVNAVIMTNRILGFVNAPALAQRILNETINESVDLDIYRSRRQAMAEVLDAAGIEYLMPRGAFYFFPKSPVEDEMKFIDLLMDENILVVPGRGFGYPGYFRLAFCVDEATIRRSKSGFINAMKKLH